MTRINIFNRAAAERPFHIANALRRQEQEPAGDLPTSSRINAFDQSSNGMQAVDVAARALGLSETAQKAALSDYLTTGGQNLDPETTAWCAAFVNASLAQAGMQGTNSLAARSFLDWGQKVDTPQRGDIAVFSRGDPNGWQGHVGFFEGYNPDGSIRVLGGNQSDAVSIANYPANRLLGFRRA